MELGLDVLGFALKVFIVVAGFVAIVLTIVAVSMRNRDSQSLDVTDLTEKLKELTRFLKSQALEPGQTKAWLKSEKKKLKQEKKLAKSQDHAPQKRVFVVDFNGDIKASAVEQLREELTIILSVAEASRDEVVVRVESPGGVVHGYGLAASQLLRIRAAGVPLTVCVDKVAASGGYMMACVANRIVAAPFAIVGSIGVLAQLPNFNKLLKKHDVEYEEVTSGEYKRTVSLFGEITDKGRQKFTEQITDTHDLFKNFVVENRPQLDIGKVATGEYWYGRRALDLKLIDDIATSDDYLYRQMRDCKILHVQLKSKKKVTDKIFEMFKSISGFGF